MTSPPFVSYAPNREDVVLHRVLGGVAGGHYVEVGLDDPRVGSVTYALYEQGWSGISVTADAGAAARVRSARPRDRVVVGAEGLDEAVADADWAEVHVLAVDAGAAERGVLATLDVARWRPWVLVVEHHPEATEELVVAAGYELALFDGLSRFYVAAERADELRPALSVPASPLDGFTLHATRVAEEERDAAVAELRRRDEEQQSAILTWRAAALRAWATSVEAAQEQELRHQIDEHVNHVRHVDAELVAMKQTLSWRVTRPLRILKTVARRGAAG